MRSARSRSALVPSLSSKRTMPKRRRHLTSRRRRRTRCRTPCGHRAKPTQSPSSRSRSRHRPKRSSNGRCMNSSRRISRPTSRTLIDSACGLALLRDCLSPSPPHTGRVRPRLNFLRLKLSRVNLRHDGPPRLPAECCPSTASASTRRSSTRRSKGPSTTASPSSLASCTQATLPRGTRKASRGTRSLASSAPRRVARRVAREYR